MIGLVENPGPVPFEDGMSILNAVRKAGGLKRRAVVGKEIVVTSPSRKVK
ncbi:MAG: SLBB domain-containing protein [Puniceicoccaceae bacterium]